MAQGYFIKEIRDNVGVDEKHPTSCSFDVLVEYDGKAKWISIQHTDYFVWAMMDSKKLELYIDNRNFKDWDCAIQDLTELNYDWNAEMVRYLDKKYPKRLFQVLPEYNSDKLGDSFDDWDDDEDF